MFILKEKLYTKSLTWQVSTDDMGLKRINDGLNLRLRAGGGKVAEGRPWSGWRGR